MMPVASFSKIAITDEELDAVQAEAGVSLALNVTVGGVTKLSSISWVTNGIYGLYLSWLFWL